MLANGTIDATLEAYSYRAERLRDFRYSTTSDYYEESFFVVDNSGDGSRLTTDFIVYPIDVLILIVVSAIVISIVEGVITTVRRSSIERWRKQNGMTH